MSDLISRQAAIDALGNEPEVWSEKDEYEQGLNNQWHYDVNALKAVPSAERRGRWIMRDNDYIDDCKCSECGCVEYFNKGWKHFDYCPNCGAKMEGEEE